MLSPEFYYLYALLGIKEVQIIQWFVQPGARVEQFDKLCEVQSDKAATEVMPLPWFRKTKLMLSFLRLLLDLMA